ncbi:MAG: AAA family ATPase, partial [Methylocystis sp.]|nr:AAA family ATPase [Methylocystis sp.]
MPVWTSEQDRALAAVAAWLTDGEAQVFRLFGYAGTGKSTLARHVAANVDGDVAFGAFTGKAALVMRSKGCKDARTIHSLIYRATDTETEEPSFVLNEDSAAARAALIVIDECSMVDAELGRDLLSFGKKVLVLGDPAQLPPIKGGGFFTEAEPDVMLTQVHRQAAGNPIIRLSMTIREGGRLERGVYGASRIIGKDELDANLAYYRKAPMVVSVTPGIEEAFGLFH